MSKSSSSRRKGRKGKKQPLPLVVPGGGLLAGTNEKLNNRDSFFTKLRGYKQVAERYACASPIHRELDRDHVQPIAIQNCIGGEEKDKFNDVKLMAPVRKIEYPPIMPKRSLTRDCIQASSKLPSLSLFFAPKHVPERPTAELDMAIEIASVAWQSDLNNFKDRSDRLARALYSQTPDAFRGPAPPPKQTAPAQSNDSENDNEDGEGTEHLHNAQESKPLTSSESKLSDMLHTSSPGLLSLEPLDAQRTVRALERERTPLSARSAFIEKSIELGIIPLAKLHREGVIELSQYRMGDEAAIAFSEVLKLSRVEYLDISDTGIGPRGATAIFLAIATKVELEVLNLNGNNVAKQGCESLASSLELLSRARKGKGGIHDLSLARNALTDFAAMPLFKVLPSVLPMLCRLDLSNNKLGGMKSCIKFLVKVVSELPKLVFCDLSWNFINGAVGEQLAQVLRTNTNLEVMKLEFNNIGEIGGLCMGTMLRENTTLKVLDLSHNNISQRACMLIADGLKANSTLKALELNGNPVGRDGGRALLRAVSQSPAGCRIGVHDCNFQHTDPHMFNPAQAAGVYHLNLAEPYERAIAEELLQLARGAAQVTSDGPGSSDEEDSDEDEEYIGAFTDLSQVPQPGALPKRRIWTGENEPVEEPAGTKSEAPSDLGRRRTSSSASGRVRGSLLMMKGSSSQFSISLNVEEYSADRWPWSGVKIDGVSVPADARYLDFSLPESGLLELEFRELSRKKTNDDALRESGFKAVYDLVTTVLAKDAFGSKALQMIQQACEDNYFTASQAKVLAQTLPSAEMRVKAVRSLYGRIVDIPNRDKIFELLDTKSVITVQQSIGPLCQLNVDNAMGYYRLDLGSPEEREVALRLVELNAEEVRKRQKRKNNLCDVSQYQNWCAFRNLRFWPTVDQSKSELPTPITDFVPTMAKSRLAYIDFLWSNQWVLPRRGVIELDFVSWKLPPRLAQPMMSGETKNKVEGYKTSTPGLEQVTEVHHDDEDDSGAETCNEQEESSNEAIAEGSEKPVRRTKLRKSFARRLSNSASTYDRIMNQLVIQQENDVFGNEFTCFMNALEKHKYTEEKILYLRALSSGYYFTTDQVFKIARAVSESKFILFDRKKKVPSIIRQAYLAEVLVMMYSRIVDKDAFRLLFYELPAETGAVVSSRIGQLHLFDPMKPDRPYRLDLHLLDEHIVASMLIELAVKEPGENWQDEMYQGRKFELPVTWVKDPPQRGILTLKYHSPTKQDQLAKCIPVREAMCQKVSVKEKRPKIPVPILATKSLVRTANALVMANMTGWYIRQLKLVVVRYLRDLPTEVQDHVMKLMKRLANARNAKLQRIMAQRQQKGTTSPPVQVQVQKAKTVAHIEESSSVSGDSHSGSYSSDGESTETVDHEGKGTTPISKSKTPVPSKSGSANSSIGENKRVTKSKKKRTKKKRNSAQGEELDSNHPQFGDSSTTGDRRNSTSSVGSVEDPDASIAKITKQATEKAMPTTNSVPLGQGVEQAIDSINEGPNLMGEEEIDEMFGGIENFEIGATENLILDDEDSDISEEEEAFDPFLPLDLPMRTNDEKPESVLSTKQRLFVVMMFQVIDQDMSDAISLEEILSFNKTGNEVSVEEKHNIEIVTEYFQKNVTQLGFTEEEDQVTPDEWLELWEDLVRSKGDRILDDFVKGFDHRAREIEGDDTFEFMTYALREAEKMNDNLEAELFDAKEVLEKH